MSQCPFCAECSSMRLAVVSSYRGERGITLRPPGGIGGSELPCAYVTCNAKIVITNITTLLFTKQFPIRIFIGFLTQLLIGLFLPIFSYKLRTIISSNTPALIQKAHDCGFECDGWSVGDRPPARCPAGRAHSRWSQTCPCRRSCSC